jgi:D-sedoheptulose 7-phosphate isomerase
VIRRRIEESVAMKLSFLDNGLVDVIADVADRIVAVYGNGQKLLLFGNGGSAGDAQHLAAEFVGRFQLERASLPALVLVGNVSSLTAIGNDYSFSDVFARQVESLGAPGDMAIGLSTSGRSENVVRGIAVAREKGLSTVALTGEGGGRLKDVADICVCVPSRKTARIQEGHMLIGHILCELVEQTLFAPQEAVSSGAPLSV